MSCIVWVGKRLNYLFIQWCPLLIICCSLSLSLQFVHFLTSWPSLRTPLRSDWWSMATLCTQPWSRSYSWLLHGSVCLTAYPISCSCPAFVNNVHCNFVNNSFLFIFCCFMSKTGCAQTWFHCSESPFSLWVFSVRWPHSRSQLSIEVAVSALSFQSIFITLVGNMAGNLHGSNAIIHS